MTSKPWDRRRAFLIGLTGAAGTLDALAFLYLGKVFASFQSGNVLFVGLGAGAANGGLVVRAAVVLLAFFAGAAAGARLVGSRLAPGAPARAELRVLGVEAALLATFAAVWVAVGTPADEPVVRVILLALGAGAMGVQVAFALAIKIPNVVTVALTATVAYLGQRAGDRRSVADAELPTTRLLVELCATYTICAMAIALLPETALLSLAPLALLSAAVAVDRLSAARRTSPQGR